jgi:hypothetical protein
MALNSRLNDGDKSALGLHLSQRTVRVVRPVALPCRQEVHKFEGFLALGCAENRCKNRVNTALIIAWLGCRQKVIPAMAGRADRGH